MPKGAQDVDAVLEGAHGMDRLTGGIDVASAALLDAVGAHVVDHARGGDDDAVAALLDALDVAEHGVGIRRRRPAAVDGDDAPGAPQVGSARRERLGAAGEHGRGQLVAVAAGRGVGDGDVVGAHEVPQPR